MKRMNEMKKVLIATMICLMVLTGNGFAKNNTQAATIRNTDTTAPASGNIYVSVTGSFTTGAKQAIIDRINAIRKEACNQGVIDPDTGKKLTASDYKPVAWSAVLEDYARIRSSEITVNWDHTRPSNKSPFTNNTTKKLNGYHSGENIAMGYTVLQSIEAYYSEKADWVKKTGRMTGHYENIIRPRNTLVGMAGFKEESGYEYSAMEFGVPSGTNDNNKNDVKGTVNQLVEVNVKFLVSSVSIKGNNSVVAGKSTKLTAVVKMIDEMPKADVYKGATWSSSNTNIATVDANGNVTGKAAGTATIKVNVAGKTATYNVTVTGGVKATSVKLNATTKSALVGESFTLTATVAPTNATNKNVTWTSSNTKVATVDAKGKVTLKAAGSATITATTADGSKKTATCKITVKAPVKATSVKLNVTTRTIYTGSTYTLTATVAPTNVTNNKVTYTSSNTAVATVDANGKITAKKAGTATITVKTNDGSNKTATCKVTVKNVVKVTGIKLNATSKTLKNGATFQLKGTLAPENATNKNVTWTSSNTKVATVDKNGKVTAKGLGSATITVTTNDGNKKATCKIVVSK
jgi:uncharacterized protein YjdB